MAYMRYIHQMKQVRKWFITFLHSKVKFFKGIQVHKVAGGHLVMFTKALMCQIPMDFSID